MKHRITIGIDPSISCSGIAIFKDKTLVSYGTIKTKPSWSMGERLKYIYDTLKKCESDTLRSSKDLSGCTKIIVGMETPFLGRNIKSFQKLCYIQALIYLWAQERNIKLHTFSPCEVKMGVTGKGNASKEELASRIVLLYPSLKGVSFDVTDAVAVALCTSNIFTV